MIAPQQGAKDILVFTWAVLLQRYLNAVCLNRLIIDKIRALM